jgi:hypothetical protein
VAPKTKAQAASPDGLAALAATQDNATQPATQGQVGLGSQSPSKKTRRISKAASKRASAASTPPNGVVVQGNGAPPNGVQSGNNHQNNASGTTTPSGQKGLRGRKSKDRLRSGDQTPQQQQQQVKEFSPPPTPETEVRVSYREIPILREVHRGDTFMSEARPNNAMPHKSETWETSHQGAYIEDAYGSKKWETNSSFETNTNPIQAHMDRHSILQQNRSMENQVLADEVRRRAGFIRPIRGPTVASGVHEIAAVLKGKRTSRL